MHVRSGNGSTRPKRKVQNEIMVFGKCANFLPCTEMHDRKCLTRTAECLTQIAECAETDSQPTQVRTYSCTFLAPSPMVRCQWQKPLHKACCFAGMHVMSSQQARTCQLHLPLDGCSNNVRDENDLLCQEMTHEGLNQDPPCLGVALCRHPGDP